MKKAALSLTASLALAGLGVFLTLWFLSPTPAYAIDYTVGGACGSTIQACINFAGPGDTVIVPAGTWIESVTLSQPINLTGVSSATAVIQAIPGQRVLTVTEPTIDSNVVISGLTFTGGDVSGGNTCFSGDPTNCGGGVLLTNNAQPFIQNVIIENNQAYRGGGLYANETGGVILDRVVFRNNSALLSGGGLQARNMPVSVTNSLFQQNTTTHNVGGALLAGADFGIVAPVFISNTHFISNTAQCSGIICEAPTVYLFDQDTMIVNSHFEGNICTAANCDGGGLFMSSSFNSPSLSLVNSDFINNTAGGGGGGVRVGNLAQMTVINGRFQGNVALSDDGGGLNHGNFIIAANASISGTQFISNSAALEGGGLYSVSDLAIRDAIFERNSSGEDGGGLLIDFGGAGSSLTNTNFISNTSQSDGGGAFVYGDNLSVSRGSFSGNSALADGGGLHACGDVTLTDLMLMSNTAQENGGGAYVGPRDGVSGCGSGQNVVIVTNAHFESNVSQATPTFFNEGGGGLYVAYGTSSLMISTTDFISNQAALGGGVHAIGEAVLISGTFQNNTATASNGGGIRAINGLTVDGTQFIGNVSGFAGGGAQAGGPADVRNALFENNQAHNGGGLDVDDVVTLDNVQFLYNSAITTTGGGLNASAALTVTNSLFQGNSSASSGGGLNGFNGQFVLSNTQFLTNTAVNGGGLNFTFNPFNGVDVIIRGNAASGNGGGLATFGTATLSGNWEISGNTAEGDGGGVWANSRLNGVNGRIENNSSGGSGGGYYGGLALLYVKGTVFAGNQAGGDGGGAYAFDGRAVGNALFEGNTAAGAGGGLFLQRFAHITATQLLGNEADLGGGLAISRTNSGTSVQFIHNAVFARNTATTSGAGLYYNQPRPINLIHNTFAQAGQGVGAAVYVVTGTVDITNTIIASHTTGIENAGGLVASNFNLFYGNDNDTVGTITLSNTLVGPPNFVDAADDDFRLMASSIAIDSGTDAGVLTDILGAARPQDGNADGIAITDRGAYEFPTQITPTSVSISGPTIGSIDINYTFTASIEPVSTTLPLTYTWLATGQDPLTNTGGITDSVTFAWNLPGTKVLTVTASNIHGTVTDTHVLTIAQVPISGLVAMNNSPTELGSVTTLSATISAGTDVSYNWDFGDEVTRTGEVVPHTYATAGVFTATVTASNPVSTITATTMVTVTEPLAYVHLPLIMKSPQGAVIRQSNTTPSHGVASMAMSVPSFALMLASCTAGVRWLKQRKA